MDNELHDHTAGIGCRSPRALVGVGGSPASTVALREDARWAVAFDGGLVAVPSRGAQTVAPRKRTARPSGSAAPLLLLHEAISEAFQGHLPVPAEEHPRVRGSRSAIA